jgi:hypothetical protein
MTDTTTDTFNPDGLIAGDNPAPLTRTMTIISGQNVTRGTVMGKITASGKLSIVNDANSDGTENPYSVMAQDVDASGGDKSGLTFELGLFDGSKLTFGGDDVLADHRDAMHGRGLYVKDTVVSY